MNATSYTNTTRQGKPSAQPELCIVLDFTDPEHCLVKIDERPTADKEYRVKRYLALISSLYNVLEPHEKNLFLSLLPGVLATTETSETPQ